MYIAELSNEEVKFDDTFDHITLCPLKTIGNKIRDAANKSGKSLQEYILDAVDKQIAFDETGENELDAKVIVNLMAWLKAHGHNDGEVLDCLSSLSNVVE